MNIFSVVHHCKRTNNANNATHYAIPGKKGRNRFKRNYYSIFSKSDNKNNHHHRQMRLHLLTIHLRIHGLASSQKYMPKSIVYHSYEI